MIIGSVIHDKFLESHFFCKSLSEVIIIKYLVIICCEFVFVVMVILQLSKLLQNYDLALKKKQFALGQILSSVPLI